MTSLWQAVHHFKLCAQVLFALKDSVNAELTRFPSYDHPNRAVYQNDQRVQHPLTYAPELLRVSVVGLGDDAYNGPKCDFLLIEKRFSVLTWSSLPSLLRNRSTGGRRCMQWVPETGWHSTRASLCGRT